MIKHSPFRRPIPKTWQGRWYIVQVYCRLYVQKVITADECGKRILYYSLEDLRMLRRANKEIRYIRRCLRNGSHKPCKWPESFREKVA